MKLIKFIAITIFMVCVFLSCKKINNENAIAKNEEAYSVQKGVVTFNSVASYLNVIENKNDEWPKYYNKMEEVNFKSLKKNEATPQSSNFTAGSINQITNAFDSDLYTDYLLSILNQDKIVSINGFTIKVDMDNNFCSAIDATLYPNESSDILNNNFNNSHVLVFKHTDEPVLEVLENLRNGTYTWTQYQDEVATRKGGGGGNGGVCLEQGMTSRFNANTKVYGPHGAGQLMARARYIRNFLNFQLKAEAWGNGNNLATNVRMYGSYTYKGQCKGAYSASFDYPANTWYRNQNFYQGGSPLNSCSLQTTTYSPTYQLSVSASIN